MELGEEENGGSVKRKGGTRELIKNFVLKTKHYKNYPWIKAWCTGPPDHNDNRCRFTCRFCGEHRSLKTKLKESLIRHFMGDKHYFVDVRYRVSVNLPIYTQPQNVTELPRLATQHEAEVIKAIAFRNSDENIRFKLRGYKKLYLQDMTPLGDTDPNSVRTTQISLYVRLLRRGVSLNLARELWDSLGSLSGSKSFCTFYSWDGPHVMSVLVSMFLILISCPVNLIPICNTLTRCHTSMNKLLEFISSYPSGNRFKVVHSKLP